MAAMGAGAPKNPAGERNATHGHPAWSRDGSAIVFNAHPGRNSRIYLMGV